MLRTLAIVCVLSCNVALLSCNESDAKEPQATVKTATLPESYWLDLAPGDALGIHKANEVAETGKEMTVVGRVGNLSEKRAQFQLIDTSFVPCSEKNPPTGCKTPWDYCCEETHVLNKGTVIVEFRDGDKLRKVTTKGFHGLDHLKEIVVRGKAIKDDAGNIILVASGMHVKN